MLLVTRSSFENINVLSGRLTWGIDPILSGDLYNLKKNMAL